MTSPTVKGVAEVRNALLAYAVKNYRVEEPGYQFDGTEVKTVEQYAVAAGIPLAEAKARARHVRDAAYWGMPVGTLIKPGMKPKGRANSRSAAGSTDKPAKARKYKQAVYSKVITHNGELPTEYLRAGRSARQGTSPSGIDLKTWERIKEYFGAEASKEMNARLRSGKPLARVKLKMEGNSVWGATREYDLPAMRAALKKGIASGRITHDAILWRGVYLTPSQVARYKPGAIVRDKAPASTATDFKGVEHVMRVRAWGYPEGSKAYYFKILAPEGTKAVMGSPRVKEIILGEDTPMRVVGIDGNVITLEVE